MKKLILPALAILLAASLAIAVYWFWPRGQRSDVPRVAEGKKTDPIQHFLPADWSIASSKVQVLESIYLPFLHRKFLKKNVRVAQIEGAGCLFYSPKMTYTNSRLSRGTVVTLANTGQLLRIELHGDIPTGPLRGQMTLAEAEDYYQSVTEKYFDLPKDNSQLAFKEILDRLYRHGSAEIEKAARIEAVYVMEAADDGRGRAPTAKWIVNFFGFPPYPARGASKSSDEARSYLRYTVDASGQVLSSDSLP